jgi:phosphinothricin acetyltransferase
VTVVRPATAGDLAGVAAIYAREVRDGVATFDTEDPPASRWTDRLASAEPGDHFLVADVDGAVAGFAYSAPYRPKLGYRQTRETTVYVAPGCQGRGLGRGLYDELLDRLRGDAIHTALAGIALPNPASVRLHESVGFAHLGTMREVGRKLGRWIDVAWYQRLL